MANKRNNSGIQHPGKPVPKPKKKQRRRKKRQSGNDRCEMTINVDSKGTINIYNCPPEQTDVSDPAPQQECPPRATGACIPLAPGSKHKQSMQAKLEKLIANTPVPSVLAATMMQQTRRFLQGNSPGNDLESSVFAVLRNLPPELQNTLSCTVEMFDGLTTRERDALFEPEVFSVGNQALSPELIANLFTQELELRVADELFDDRFCTEERPGLPRPIFSTINGGAFLGFPPRICRVNGLRTIHFAPFLGVGDYEPDEFQQTCTPELVDEEIVLNCEVQTEDCPGHQTGGSDGPCLRVPEVRNGETVVLEGVNFINVEATVRLQAQAPATASAEVDAFVCGDHDTPATEEINGEEVAISDCRVQDRLTFQIPDELPVGIYEVRVVVPNDTGIEDTDPVYISPEIYISVIPPNTAVFQVASETLHAEKETSPAWIGSDEVGLKIITASLFADSSLGDMRDVSFRFNNVDSGDTRDMSSVLLQESGLAGAVIAIVGFEVDSESAFENQIDAFTDNFIAMLKLIWDAIKEEASAAVAAIVKKYGIKGLIAVVIAAAILLAVVAIVALWAPADLIIEDSIGLSVVELASLTSANFPIPQEIEYSTGGEIDVKVVPVSKGVQYRERREYRSDDEDSEYHIILRYNRLS
jgi:hypothetical protein